MAYQRTEKPIPTFEIDTRNTCIFCLRPGSSENSTGTHGGGESCRESVGGTALKLLLRYLKIDVLQLSHQNDAGRAEAEVEAVLCEECQEGTADFRRFLNEMEAVRLKLSKSLVTISGRIQKGNEVTGRTERFHETMSKTKNLVELMYTENLVDNLRRSTLEKCLLKVEASTPLVILNDNSVGATLRTGTTHEACSESTSRNIRNEPQDFDLPAPEGSSSTKLVKHYRYNKCKRQTRFSESKGSVEENGFCNESIVEVTSINDTVENGIINDTVENRIINDTVENRIINDTVENRIISDTVENRIINDMMDDGDNSPKHLPSTSKRQAATSVNRPTTSTSPRGRVSPKRYRAEIWSSRRMVGRKPFKCGVCGSKLTSKKNLNRHMSHSSVKPFQCQLCPKAFVQSRSLQDHIRTHTNELPYTCDLCKKSFRTSYNLSRHKGSIHSEI